MTPDNRPDDNRRRRYPPHLNPDNVPAKPPRWEIWAIVLVVAMVSALLTAGVYQVVERSSLPKTPKIQDETRLVGVSQQLAVIVVSAGERREIKLLDTQNLRVQDVTRGQTTALTAALSPDGKYLTFVSDSPEGATVSMIEVTGGEPVSLATSDLLEAGEDIGLGHLGICKWTNVSWSSDSSRFILFGCNKSASAVVVIEAGKTLKAKALPDTNVKQSDPREAIWLNEREILFSQKSDTTGKTIIEKISADGQGPSVLIYGE